MYAVFVCVCGGGVYAMFGVCWEGVCRRVMCASRVCGVLCVSVCGVCVEVVCTLCLCVCVGGCARRVWCVLGGGVQACDVCKPCVCGVLCVCVWRGYHAVCVCV